MTGVQTCALPIYRSVAGPLTLKLREVPWKESGVVVVETATLRNEDPEFFRPLSKCLTPAGSLHIEKRSRTLIIRDVRERAVWFREQVKAIDGLSPARP